MFKRLIIILLITTPLFAQEATDLERRLRALEEKIAQMQPSSDLAEIRRQIEILGSEIEALKTRQTDKLVAADTEQYGLGAAASKVYRVNQGISFGGYGEMLYENFAGTNDSDIRVSNRDQFDMLRAILYTGYKYNDRVLFNSEIEYEHGSTGSGGEASVEFAYLDFLVRPDLGIRTGLVLIPMGLVNEQHEPTAYLGTKRPGVEGSIIPTTWREMGGGAFGEVGQLSWRAYIVNSLNGRNFTAGGVRGGRQKGARALSEDFALTGRLDWQPIVGTTVGTSFFSGNTGQGNMVAGEVLDARYTVYDVHAETSFRGAMLRGLWTRGTIDDAAQLNALNSLTGNRSVGESLGGWYVEGGYDLASLRGFRERSFTPYVRYEKLDTQRSVPAGFARNPASRQTIFTYGLQFKPIPEAVIKADYQDVENDAGTGLNQWNIGIGYIF
ncbi:MAG TPA: hypothetical protein VNA69_11825 [Thermoanaerobaculia bacterium]|nr:hypothetical protein [Thermoanaerobaculia bacterium]